MQLISKTITYTGDPTFTLYGIGDQHIGTVHHDKAAWARDIRRIEADPNAYWIGMGDAAECIVPTDPRFEAQEIAPEFLPRLGTIAVAQRDRFLSDVAPIAGKCIGLLEGNHEHTIRKRHYLDLTRDACRELGTTYLGESALIRLTFRRMNSDGERVRSHNVVLYVEHGHGGGKKTGGKLNSIEDLATFYDADIYFRGHVHSRAISRQIRVGLTCSGSPSLVSSPHVFGLTGCYYQGVHDGEGSYANRSGFPPTDIGCVAVRVRPSTGELETVL